MFRSRRNRGWRRKPSSLIRRFAEAVRDQIQGAVNSTINAAVEAIEDPASVADRARQLGGSVAGDDRAGDAANSGDAVELDAGYAGPRRGMDASNVLGFSRDQIGVRRIGK